MHCRVARTEHGVIEYVASGRGPALLAFHGAIGNADSMAWFVRAFSSRFQVIVPSLGDTDDVDEFCRRVNAVLHQEQVSHAIVFGISFGGLLAQSFVRRHPERVDRLILMSCGAPRYAAASMFRAASWIARTLPLPAVRWLTSLFLSRRLVHAPDARGAIRRALAAHRRRLESAADGVNRELMVGRFRIAADVHRAERDIRAALEAWRGRILLLMASDDPLFSPRARNRIGEAFPQSQLHTFPHGGHLIPLFNAEEMRQIVIRFASEDNRDQAAIECRDAQPASA